MNRVDKDRHAYADDRLEGTVEDVDVGVRVLNVVYRYAQKDNSGEESILRDVQQNGGVDHQTREDSEQDIKDHSGAEVAALGQEFQKQDCRTPEGADQCAYDAVLALSEHVGGVGLHALQGGDDRVEGLAAHAAKDVDDHTEPDGDDRADDTLTGRLDPDPGCLRDDRTKFTGLRKRSF